MTADGAYDTRKCHEAIAGRNAAAVIPPRQNAKPWKPTSPGAVARNEALRASNYLGRAIWRRWSGYHPRSRVESKMNCIKLLGQSPMARDFERQVAELQVRIAVLNDSHGNNLVKCFLWHQCWSCISVPGPNPFGTTRPASGHDQPHIRSPHMAAAPISRLRRARVREDGTILLVGTSGQAVHRSIHPDRSGLIGS